MPKALILSLQPPGGGGVQARRYAKLLPHLPEAGWEFHVVGPDPRLDAVTPEPFPGQKRFCHYSHLVSRSHRCAIRKNRRRAGTPLHLWFGLRQLIHQRLERLGRHNPQAHALEGLRATALETAAAIPFDLVAGICPDFRVLEVALDVAAELDEKRKELEYQIGFVASVQGKLSNERFVSGAPEAVVAKEKAKLADGQERIKILEDDIRRLEGMV